MTYHPPSTYHSQAITAVAASFIAIAFVFTTLRFFVRGLMIRALGWDDWLILLALCSFLCQACFLIHIEWMKQHYDLETLKPLSTALEYVVLEFAFYLMTTTLLKLSLAVFFLRILLEKWQRRVIVVSTVIFTIFSSAFFFVAVFQCGNPGFYLVHKLQGKCIPWSALGPLNYIHGVLNTLTDWIFVSLPIFVIRKAHMRGRAKSSVMLILLIGVFGSVASFVRLFYIKDLHSGDQSATQFFSNTTTIAIASTIEPGLGIAAACMGTLRPLFKGFFDHTRAHVLSISNKNKTSTTECGIPSRSGPTSPPVSPQRCEFAAYGFVSESKSRANSEDAKKAPMIHSDEIMAFDEERESQDALLAELESAKQAYSARIWIDKEQHMLQPNLLLPDI